MRYDHLNSPLYKLLIDGRQVKFPKGQVVTFGDSDLVHFIKAGYIKRYLITKDGSMSIQIIYGPGDIFPLSPVRKSIFNEHVYTTGEQYYHEAMTDLEIYSTTVSSLLQALEQDPLIYKDLFYAAGVRINSNVFRLENMSLRVTNRKVAHLLIHLSDIFGEKVDDGTRIKVPLTHQNVADMLNMARETVTLTLARLEDKGLIRVAEGKHIIVLDLDGLNQVYK